MVPKNKSCTWQKIARVKTFYDVVVIIYRIAMINILPKWEIQNNHTKIAMRSKFKHTICHSNVSTNIHTINPQGQRYGPYTLPYKLPSYYFMELSWQEIMFFAMATKKNRIQRHGGREVELTWQYILSFHGKHTTLQKNAM